MVTASPNLGTDSVRLWGKYFLAKNMAMQIPVLLTDLLAYAKMALGLQKEFPLQMLCHLTNASFVLCAKSTLRTALTLYLIHFFGHYLAGLCKQCLLQ